MDYNYQQGSCYFDQAKAEPSKYAFIKEPPKEAHHLAKSKRAGSGNRDGPSRCGYLSRMDDRRKHDDHDNLNVDASRLRYFVWMQERRLQRQYQLASFGMSVNLLPKTAITMSR
jgi:hypothetical protein